MPIDHLNCKMYLHPIVSFLVGVILDLLQLKFNGNQGGRSSDDSSTSPFNTHPLMILLGVLWLLLYSWVALAASTTTSSSLPTSASPLNRVVVASDPSAATICPSALAPRATSAKIAVAETPRSSASAVASCSSSAAPATSSNALPSSAKRAVVETPLSSASTAASCSSSPAQATSSNSLLSAVAEPVLSVASCSSPVAATSFNSLSSAVAETVLSAASDAASCSSPAATSNPSLLAHRDAEVVIMIPTSSPAVAVSATSSSWISRILGKISNAASKLIAKIKCPREQLMLMFASMAISTFGCLLFPTSAQYHVLYTSYALIIGFNAIFLCLLPR